MYIGTRKKNFFVHQILDDECKRAKRCESCKVDFPKKNPKIGSDLVLVHKDRYMRTNFDSFGKRGEPILTTQLGRKFYCAKKKCPLKQLPIFGKSECLCEDQSVSKHHQDISSI